MSYSWVFDHVIPSLAFDLFRSGVRCFYPIHFRIYFIIFSFFDIFCLLSGFTVALVLKIVYIFCDFKGKLGFEFRTLI